MEIQINNEGAVVTPDRNIFTLEAIRNLTILGLIN